MQSTTSSTRLTVSLFAFCLLATPVFAKTYLSEDSSAYATERHARIAEFGFMVGIWDIRANEKSSDGQFLEEHGTRSCVWALNRTAIRCDDSLTRVRASERYQPVGKQRNALFYLTFDEATGNFEYTFMSADSPIKQIFQAEYDPDSRVLTNTAPMDPLGRNEVVQTQTKQWLVSDDEIRQQSSVASPNLDYTEVFNMVLNRQVGAGRSVGHF